MATKIAQTGPPTHIVCKHITEQNYPTERCLRLADGETEFFLCRLCWSSLKGVILEELMSKAIEEGFKAISTAQHPITSCG